jgi:hypothetical protein
MARRASSATNPAWFFAAALLIAGAIGVGWWIKARVSDPFRTLPALPVSEFMQNSNSLRGNTYKFSGVIGDQLGYNPSNRIFEVRVGGDAMAPVPVLVPSNFNHLDLRKEQRFQFKVEVGDKGLLLAKDIQKE